MHSNPHIQYTISFSGRRTLSILASPDRGIIVKAPYRTPVRTIEKFVQEKSGWIIRTLKGFKTLTRLDDRAGYSDGDLILLFGREHKLKLSCADRYSVRLGNNQTIVATYVKDNNPLIIRNLLENWFKFIASGKLTVKFREILSRYGDYGFLPAGFKVKKMKSRWGSCSSKNSIGISYDLVRLDERFSEYVIIHELCHLKHHNHGSGFYRLLSEVYPDWKNTREGLKKYLR